MMASENVFSTLPSSGRPDARNDDDNDAEEGVANREDGVGSEQHVYGNYTGLADLSQIETIYQNISMANGH